MTSYLMEAVILAFTIGGIVGAIGALQITHRPAPVKVHNEELDRN